MDKIIKIEHTSFETKARHVFFVPVSNISVIRELDEKESEENGGAKTYIEFKEPVKYFGEKDCHVILGTGGFFLNKPFEYFLEQL